MNAKRYFTFTRLPSAIAEGEKMRRDYTSTSLKYNPNHHLDRMISRRIGDSNRLTLCTDDLGFNCVIIAG